jgi:hypothetical protein
MGQVLHGSARTTAAVRRTIQHSQESLKTRAERYDINPTTGAKWKRREYVHDVQHTRHTPPLPEELGRQAPQAEGAIEPDDQGLAVPGISALRVGLEVFHHCLLRPHQARETADLLGSGRAESGRDMLEGADMTGEEVQQLFEAILPQPEIERLCAECGVIEMRQLAIRGCRARSRRPLAEGVTDASVGRAAWIVETLRAWRDYRRARELSPCHRCS